MTTANLELPFAALDIQCAEARSWSINWQSFFEKNIISPDEMTIMNELSDRSNWVELFKKEDNAYITTPLQVLGKIENSEAIIVCLAITYDTFTRFVAKTRSALLENSSCLESLQTRLLSGEELIAGHSARVLAVVSMILNGLKESQGKLLMEWIKSSMSLYPDREQRVLLATLLLEHVLRVPQLRAMFVADESSMTILTQNMIKSRNVQIQYQSLFAIWLLSFDKEFIEILQTKYFIILTLLDVAKVAIKEKIVRVCLGIWRNMLERCPSISIPVLIGSKVLDYLESITGKEKSGDEEVSEDVSVLKDSLTKAYQSLNSYDEYVSEAKSGKLEWSPPHKSELFWKDNAPRLAENEMELLKLLTFLLGSDDPQILSVALNDLGMYVSYHTPGRKNLEIIGAKQKIMTLISHGNPDVRFQALLAMQKYMKKLWNPVQ